MKHCITVLFCLMSVGLPAHVFCATPFSDYRWFQIEVSIFTNEFPEYRDAEVWSPDRLNLTFPQRIRPFGQLADFFRIAAFDAAATDRALFTANDGGASAEAASLAPEMTGPFPAVEESGLRLPDLERQPYLLLPDSLSDFQTTNTRLERSPDNRLLFHGLWRQPVMQPGEATALLIQGGSRYGERHELEGSLTIRFNRGEDRVVIDTNLWLTEFSQSPQAQTEWQLPSLPGTTGQQSSSTGGYRISRVVQMQQSREMRSTEFHYLDHPAMGLVISVLPYELPAPPSLDASLESAPDASPVPEEFNAPGQPL